MTRTAGVLAGVVCALLSVGVGDQEPKGAKFPRAIRAGEAHSSRVPRAKAEGESPFVFLELDHRAEAACTVTISIGGYEAVRGYRVPGSAAEAPARRDRIMVGRYLEPARSGVAPGTTIEVRVVEGGPWHLLRAELSDQEASSLPGSRVIADWELADGLPRGSMVLRSEGQTSRRYVHDHLRLLHAAQSEARFTLREAPRSAWLVLDHSMTTSSVRRREGTSPISLEVNGKELCRFLDPGHPAYAADAIDVSGLLKTGENVLVIRAVGDGTEYRLRRIEIRSP